VTLLPAATSATAVDTFLYHRHVMKWGGYRSQTAKKKAIIVAAHAMIVIIWHILATRKPYHELGADYFTSRLRLLPCWELKKVSGDHAAPEVPQRHEEQQER
jgi:hypothetical protein